MEETIREEQEPGAEEQEAAPDNRRTVLLIVAGIVVVVALVFVGLNLGRDEGQGIAPSVQEVLDSETAQPVTVGNGDNVATVVIRTEDDVCWNGFLISEEIEGCGSAVFEADGAPRVFGLNVTREVDLARREEPPLAVSILANGEVLEEGSVDKKSGVVGLTALFE